jgi:cell division initiation protein
MKLSPLDIQHAEFGSAMNGYNRRQVREFLDRMASELEAVLRENQKLRDSGKQFSEQINELQSSEAELKRVVIAAERIASEIRENAKREASLTVQEAQGSSQNIRAEAEAFRQKLVAEAEAFKQNLVAEAERKRHDMLTEADAQLKEARAELLRLEREQRLFREQFRALLQAFARNLESGPVALAAGRRASERQRPVQAARPPGENPETDEPGSS